MKKRILFITGTLGLGGIERQITELCLALQASGDWEPVVCCLVGSSGPFSLQLLEHHIPIHTCLLTPQNMATFPIRLARLVRSLSPDLVHSHVDFSIPWQVAGYRMGGVRKIIFTQQNDYQYWKDHALAHARIVFYYWLARPWLSAYTVVSEGVRQSFAQLVHRPLQDFQVIPNSIDLQRFQPDPANRAWARREMGVEDNHFVIGNVARFDVQKGHTYLLQGARQVVDIAPNTRFVLVGDGNLRSVIEQQIATLELGSYVTLLGRRTDVHRLYSGFDCYALSSLWEGMPIALMEAMACELPVVATQVTGVADALGDGYRWVVPSADAVALAQVILKVQADPSQARQVARQTRQRATELFGIDTVTRQYSKLYHQVLGKGNP